jgi:HlyD family secretion protein
LRRRLVQFRHRTEDARLEIVGGLPENASVVTRPESGLREGRAVRVSEAMSR